MKIFDYQPQMKALLYKGDVDVTHPQLLEEYIKLDEELRKEIFKLKSENKDLKIEVQALRTRVRVRENYK